MKAKAVVFDLFHTLVDGCDFKPRHLQRVTQAAAILKADPVHFTDYWQQNSLRRNRDRTETVRKLTEEYLHTLGRTADADLLDQVDHAFGHWLDLAIMNPRTHVVPTLQALSEQGLKIGLLSIADEREIRTWPDSPLAPWFDAPCFSCDIGYEKPHPKAYEAVLTRLGVPARAAVYVGDGGSHELEGAKAADFGLVVFMKGFVASNGMRSPQELSRLESAADATIHRLDELLLLLDPNSSEAG